LDNGRRLHFSFGCRKPLLCSPITGAHDYLAKPFGFAELAARVRALVRRGAGERPVGDLELNPAARQVTRAGQRLELTAKEFALL
jgi:two-component system OmpR family response regulator